MFIENIQETIRDDRMLASGDRVLVAVSGGPDSVCLLHVLHTLGYALEAAHFDHQTRNGESAGDAEFVRDLAERLSLPFHTSSRPIANEARAARCSFEAYARRARYDFLVRTAADRQCSAVATGHHAGDHVETILLRILRGTTAQGLGGIRPVREQGGLRIIRPLIRCSREDIMGYLSEHALSYRTDVTNGDATYPRNRVRHDLLPYLAREFNPRIRDALVRLGEAQQCDSDFLSAAADVCLDACFKEGTGIDRHVFATFHRAIQGRILSRVAWRHGIDCPFDRVRAAVQFVLEAPTGHYFDLGHGISLCNGRLTTDVTLSENPASDEAFPLRAPGITRAFERQFAISDLKERPREPLKTYCTPFRQVFDADSFGCDVTVRHRRPGDRFVPYGMSGSRKLQDYLVDIGVPVSHRDAQLLVIAGGHIAWIVGHAIGAHVAVTTQTRRLTQIEVSDAT